MGFKKKWIGWIMECISSVSCNLIINEQSGTICPTRGLRHVDHLSSYLFLFIADVLSITINKAVESNRMFDIKLGRECPSLSHLSFADDSIFFMPTVVRNVSVLKSIMEK